MYKIVRRYLELGSCINESDLLRKALSYYLKSEAPRLYEEMLNPDQR